MIALIITWVWNGKRFKTTLAIIRPSDINMLFISIASSDVSMNTEHRQPWLNNNNNNNFELIWYDQHQSYQKWNVPNSNHFIHVVIEMTKWIFVGCLLVGYRPKLNDTWNYSFWYSRHEYWMKWELNQWKIIKT